MADNTGGGASGDGTEILRELVQVGARSTVVACLWDPAAVAACAAAGVGRRITLDVGGKVDARHGAPLTVTGVVRTLSDGRFVHKGPMMRGLPGRLGATAVLDVNDVKVILISYRWQTLDPEMIRFVGIDPLGEKILVVKSTIHYRAAFEPIAKEIVEVDAPGLSSSNLDRFASSASGGRSSPWTRRRVPVSGQLASCSVSRRPACPSPVSPGRLQGVRIDGLQAPHGCDRTQIRPKLEASRASSARRSRIGGAQAFAHVAKHARRTVNPPGDTWVAFALDKRGYKKHCHFKVALSREAVRFLFEAGPEHADKKRWAAAWKRHTPQLVPVLRQAKGSPGSRTSTTRRRRPY